MVTVSWLQSKPARSGRLGSVRQGSDAAGRLGQPDADGQFGQLPAGVVRPHPPAWRGPAVL